MANPQTHVIRSISLPSRLHPTDFETDLLNLKSSQINSVTNSETIRSGLVGLAELYNFAQDNIKYLIRDTKCTEESLLSCSVELLDACSNIRDVFEMIRENVRSLQSALRRKGLDSVPDEIKTHFSCRKKTCKNVAKTLKNLKNSERGIDPCSVSGDALREITGAAIVILKSVLVFLSPSSSGSSKGWSLVSKVMNTKSVGANGVANEIESVDLVLNSLLKSNNGVKVVDVHKSLQNLEDVVRGFEGALEVLFRQLVRFRVELLNFCTV